MKHISFNPRTVGGRLSAPLRFFADFREKTAAHAPNLP